MNRTDRLYAIVEQLRAVRPGRRSARELAARHEVSVRTIERDIRALQQAGVPIYADAGRRGGYTLDKTMTLPPLNFTPAEAVAVAVALDHAGGMPFAQVAASAVHKILAAMSTRDSAAARDLAHRIRLLDRPDDKPRPIPSVIQDAIVGRQVLRLTYLDRDGARTERVVEPVVLAAVRGRQWYLVAHCRLRRGPRAFRIDRVVHAAPTGERAPAHSHEAYTLKTCDLGDRAPDLAASSRP